MVKLQLLSPWTIFRTTPPVIMPECENRRKGSMYFVLAPSVEEELKWLSENKVLLYRELGKYFIEKKWEPHLRAQATRIVKPNANGEVDALLGRYRSGNLKKVTAVTSVLEPSQGINNVLKGYNVLVEINHVTEAVINNPKDHRTLSLRVADLYGQLNRVLDPAYLGSYQRHTLVIPMDLWFKTDDYKTPAAIMRPRTGNLMGILLDYLCNPYSLSRFGTNMDVVLVDQNFVMILGENYPDRLSDEKKEAFARKQVQTFMTKARLIRLRRDNLEDHHVITVEDTPEEPEDDPSVTELKKAEERTEAEVRTEKVLMDLGVDDTSVPVTTRRKIAAAVSQSVEKETPVTSMESPKKPEAQPAEGSNPVPDPRNTTAAQQEKQVRTRAKVDDQSVPKDDKLVSTTKLDAELDRELRNVELDNSTQKLIYQAQMESRSGASQLRNQQLREKYKGLNLGTTKLTDLVDEQRELSVPKVPVAAHTVNESLKKIRGQRSEEKYDETLAQHDLVSILLHFSGVHPALYLNRDIEVEDVSTRNDRVIRYGVQFEDEDRKRHSFHFKLPKMYKHKYLYLNGQELVITHQKLPFPITKVQQDRCQLVTNYNKIFIYRYGTALSPRMTKLKKILNGSLPTVMVRRGDCTKLNGDHLTTIEFDELAGSFERIRIGRVNDSVTIFFDPDVAAANFRPSQENNRAYYKTLENEKMDPPVKYSSLIRLAVRKQKDVEPLEYWLSSDNNMVYDVEGRNHGELSEWIMNLLVEYNPTMEKEFADTAAGTKFMYSRVRIMAQDIPLVLVMGAADPDGLVGALEKGKINYQFLDKRPAVDKNTTGVIPFADGYLVYDRYPMENSLLLNGLQLVPTREYGFYDFNVRETYVEIFDLLCGQRTLADNMVAFYYMMIDPITRDVLERLNMPTDFTTLLHWCNGVLVDNQFQIDSNYENSRIRSNEIIMAHLYRELAVAWSNYRSGRTDTFSIPEDTVIKLLLTSKIVDPKSKLNISLELENDRNVKLKGPSGMNEDHSFTIEKRAFHPTMRGVVGTNSTASGEIGINRHMVVNANIDDARGFITVNKKDNDDYDGTELLTPGEMLAPFSAESADIERLCMSISQAKHVVPVAKGGCCPVSFDFERVAPYLSNDFSFVTKQPGEVVEINENLMILKYADGTYDDVDLSEHPAKNTDGGFYIMNKLDTDLTVGQRFEANQIVAYDRKVVSGKDFFGDPSASVGVLARVCFESDGNVYEDAGYITDKFAHELATKITKQKRIILSKYANIKKMAAVGQHVQANDVILAFDDTEDEFSSQLLASIADQMGDDDEITATSAPVITKYTGVIKDIDITFTVPPEEMSPSLRAIVENYSKQAAKREKILGKYMNPYDANSFIKGSSVVRPDGSGKVAGTKIDEGVIIDFYIEYDDVAGNGDKGSITALKFTTCNVVPAELAGYTESNPGRPIDLHVASFGAFKRMVADVEKMGVLNKILVESKRTMKERFGERIKSELAKTK